MRKQALLPSFIPRAKTGALCATLILASGCGSGSNLTVHAGTGFTAFRSIGNGSYRTIYKFGQYRGGPYGAGGQFIAIDGIFYGTTAFGGHGFLGNGTVFSLTPSGEEHDLYKFRNTSSGHNPNQALIAVDRVLYGTTLGGGGGCPQESGCGTIFAVTRSGRERTLYHFKGGSDGITPSGGLVWLGGKFYGVTSNGGSAGECPGSVYGTGCGIVFSVDTSGNESVVYRFRGKRDGAAPNGPLLALGGKLYGTTGGGGAGGNCDHSCGTLFEVTTSGAEKVLHRFGGGSDGSGPVSGMLDIDGVLYGTTGSDGLTNSGCCGTVFKATTSGAESPIYLFKGPPDAASPNGRLVVRDGLIYGTASGGDTCFYFDSGTIFGVSIAGEEHVAYTFSCKSVNQPTGLTLFKQTLYGSASDTIFAFTP
ncbi:MAG TPA: choice-of-anchor tandem repeat GloVer-containing protein [Candidatus Babeliales bacterium]|nr:choice-of-anchor tandem repeat GloVer-containing protein [Candidatus Babeliales bacterium]